MGHLTPEKFARHLARSRDLDDVILGAAIIFRGLTDDWPGSLRQGWPKTAEVAASAARYAGVRDDLISPEFCEAVVARAPSISDAMLNRGASGAADVARARSRA